MATQRSGANLHPWRNPSGGGHFGFVKVVVDVVGRGIVQSDYRRNKLLGSLESA